ncbi:hypothetical protein EDB86DRAFT_1466672 [Lactarius hatsudake]|nr:hypothetical protein EDB86DRAFT_1466672 [Lactarius hatsudake]
MSDSNRKRSRPRSPPTANNRNSISASTRGIIFCHCLHRNECSRISSKTSASHFNAFRSAAPTFSSTVVSPARPPSTHIHIQCLIVTRDASIIIGKGGALTNEAREKHGARVIVSESIPGTQSPEHILNSGVSMTNPLMSSHFRAAVLSPSNV